MTSSTAEWIARTISAPTAVGRPRPVAPVQPGTDVSTLIGRIIAPGTASLTR